MRTEKQRQATKNWEKRNADYMRQRQQDKRNATRKWIKEEILDSKACLRCDESHPGCLDFHHRDPSQKVEEVMLMAAKKYSRDNILAEIAKCDILCANCHRKLHWEEDL